MNKPVIISADSPVDLSGEAAAQRRIKTIPLHIILGGASYRDGVDIDAQRLFAYYRENRALPSTAAVSVAEYADFFGALKAGGAEVVHLSLSATLSSTHHNAVLAAEETDGVYVVDTQSLSSGMALLALFACGLRDDGLSARDICRAVRQKLPDVRVSFILDTLDYMSKGGRCSAVTAFGANLLGIKPSLEMSGGTLAVAKKYRGKPDEVMARYVADRLSVGEDIDTARAFLVHTGLGRDRLDALRRAILRLVPFEELHEAVASCTISTHCGPGCMGVMYMVK